MGYVHPQVVARDLGTPPNSATAIVSGLMATANIQITNVQFIHSIGHYQYL